ncbi:MAG: RecX family transcriptional regulator [Alphaproteobacteria bacterium]|jgi:regulatory protein|nr:RecX family transcriptional regulator [Alphaproteobacteria bacterium]MDP6781743.1 RecX family transcriptional regulator [Alphaproteobacteria bacterium]
MTTASKHQQKTGSRRTPRKATARYLESAALYYMERFSSSVANLRRVMIAKVERSARFHGTDRGEGAAQVEDIIARFLRTGLLDDGVYATAKAASLHRRGSSSRAIRAKLMAKGVGGSIIDKALVALEGEDPDPEFSAAITFSRRRRIGPFRRHPGPGAAPENHEKDHKEDQQLREKELAALGRAGFCFDIARRIVDAQSEESLSPDGRFI